MLRIMVKNMCTQAGITGHKTNHSLRATGATALYQAGVPENIIQERTGHLSLKGLRQYERTSDDQHQAVARVLAASEQTLFAEQLSLSKTDSCTTTTSTDTTVTVTSTTTNSVTVPCQAVAQFSFGNCQVTINNHY